MQFLVDKPTKQDVLFACQANSILVNSALTVMFRIMHSLRKIFSLTITRLLALFLLVVCSSELALAQSEFSKLVVFGDSLSDTGNLAVVNLPPPYFENRISDGPVLADLLAAEIGSNANRSGHLLGSPQGFNYAVAGGNILGSDPEDLNAQVSSYLQRVGDAADPNALYLVFIGGNDLRGLRSQPSVSVARSEITAIIARLDFNLSRLVAAGARTFIVPNVANIGRIPETLSREAQQPGISVRAENYTRIYNAALTAMLDKYRQNPALSLVEFNLFSAFEVILNDPNQFGFSTVEQGCFDPSTFEVDVECLIFGFERRAFFDQLHPSSATNQIVFDSLRGLIPSHPSSGSSIGFIAIIAALLLDD